MQKHTVFLIIICARFAGTPGLKRPSSAHLSVGRSSYDSASSSSCFDTFYSLKSCSVPGLTVSAGVLPGLCNGRVPRVLQVCLQFLAGRIQISRMHESDVHQSDVLFGFAHLHAKPAHACKALVRKNKSTAKRSCSPEDANISTGDSETLSQRERERGREHEGTIAELKVCNSPSASMPSNTGLRKFTPSTGSSNQSRNS